MVHTLHVIIIQPGAVVQIGGQKIDILLGAAENEIEQFWRMEMVDMIIWQNGCLIENREV